RRTQHLEELPPSRAQVEHRLPASEVLDVRALALRDLLLGPPEPLLESRVVEARAAGGDVRGRLGRVRQAARVGGRVDHAGARALHARDPLAEGPLAHRPLVSVARLSRARMCLEFLTDLAPDGRDRRLEVADGVDHLPPSAVQRAGDALLEPGFG